MQFSSSGGLSSLSPSARDSVDPIAELLSQLSGVRRTAASSGSTPSQLQQLQMQLQLERTQVRAARQQLERLPRRQAAASGAGAPSATAPLQTTLPGDQTAASPTPVHTSQLMLTRCLEASLSDGERESAERSRADRSLFVQELVLTTLSDDPQPVTRSEPKVAYCGTAAARDFPRSLDNPGPKRPATRGRPPVSRPSPAPTAAAPARPHHPGTGTVREVPLAPAPAPAYTGTTRRKPVRPVQTSEPPPSH